MQTQAHSDRLTLAKHLSQRISNSLCSWCIFNEASFFQTIQPLSKHKKFACIHIMHLDECVKSVSLYESTVQNILVHKQQQHNFSVRNFAVIIHIPQRSASTLPGNTKCECLAYVFGRWAVLEEVMPCTEADLTIPAVLPYVSVDVALVTAITSSSDPCLQVEDHISVHHRESISFSLTLM